MIEFDENHNTQWKRTKTSLLTEWEGHHKWRIAGRARHINFDNKEEGFSIEDYDQKAKDEIWGFIYEIFPWLEEE